MPVSIGQARASPAFARWRRPWNLHPCPAAPSTAFSPEKRPLVISREIILSCQRGGTHPPRPSAPRVVTPSLASVPQWRQLQFQVDELRGQYGKVNKEVAMKKKAKEDADELIAQAKVCPTPWPSACPPPPRSTRLLCEFFRNVAIGRKLMRTSRPRRSSARPWLPSATN